MKNKIKISKSVSKRVKKITRKGKIILMSTSAQHLASNKSRRTRMTAKDYMAMSAGDMKRTKKLI